MKNSYKIAYVNKRQREMPAKMTFIIFCILFFSPWIVRQLAWGQASVGGYAWHDENSNGIQDLTERGFSGIRLQLFGRTADNQFVEISALRTESNGHYLFILSGDLLPGDFYLQFEAAPGFYYSPIDQGNDDARDSDVDASTGRTVIITIENGYNSNNWNGGYTEQSSPPQPPPPPPPPAQTVADLSLIEYANKNQVNLGDSLIYTIEITNLGPDTARQVEVLMPWSPAFLLLQSQPPPDNAAINPLSWAIPYLAPGAAQQIILQAQVLTNDNLNESACVSSQSQDNNLSNNCQFFAVDIEVPVELTSFSAFLRNDGVHLKWVTQSEKDNMGFNILRSDRSEGPFEKINNNLIAGQGNTAIKHYYEYVDHAFVAEKTTYYMLQDLDYTGHSAQHGPIVVTASLPAAYSLLQNYPNPFNVETKIEFMLSQSGLVQLTIYNLMGQPVRTLMSQEMSAGIYEMKWNGMDINGQSVASGMYLCVLEVNDYRQVRKIQVIK